MLRLSFIEEAQAERIDGNAERIIVAALRVATSVGVLRRFEIRCPGIDGRHVAGLPMARGCCSERKKMVQDLAGVVFGASHFGEVGIAGEIACPHFGARLKPAGARDHSTCADIVLLPRGANTYPL